jgi:hypothetical protein
VVKLSDVLALNEAVAIRALPDGGVLVGNNEKVCRFNRKDAEVVRTIIRSVDGKTTVSSICDGLTNACSQHHALEHIKALLAFAIRVKRREADDGRPRPRSQRRLVNISVFGCGPLATWAAGQLVTFGDISVFDADLGDLGEKRFLAEIEQAILL